MSVDTYRIWRDRISELVYKDTIYELNNDGYIDELIEKISKSRVSHFIYPQFIKWLWNSLFVDFDSIMYQQFKKLREEGIRKNFSLCSYMISEVYCLIKQEYTIVFYLQKVKIRKYKRNCYKLKESYYNKFLKNYHRLDDIMLIENL